MEKRRLDDLEREKERAKRAAEEWEKGAPERARLAEEKRIRDEQLRIQWEEEDKLRRADKQREIEDRVKKTTLHPKPCGLSLINMCDCINEGLVPEYEADRLTGKMFCKLCKNGSVDVLRSTRLLSTRLRSTMILLVQRFLKRPLPNPDSY